MSYVLLSDLGETFWILETDGCPEQYEGEPERFYNPRKVRALLSQSSLHSMLLIMKPSMKLCSSSYDWLKNSRS